MNIRFSIFIACMFPLVSCTEGIVNSLDRSTGDPTYEKPVVKSFVVANEISITWANDICADEYILERSVDSDTKSFSTVYQGKATSYVDTDFGDDGTLYLYRLLKRRGEKIFTTESDETKWSLGINSSTVRDSCELNDTTDMAVLLDVDRIVSMYYYESSSGDFVADIDWYYVCIPAHRSAQILIEDENPPSSGTHFKYQIPDGDVSGGGSICDVTDGNPIVISNTNDYEKKYVFRILPNASKFKSSLVSSGGSIVGYTVSLDSIYKAEDN